MFKGLKVLELLSPSFSLRFIKILEFFTLPEYSKILWELNCRNQYLYEFI